jgi:hypothetical protein
MDEIKIDWTHFLKSGTFIKKGEAPPVSPQLTKKSIDDFITLCKSDSKLEDKYKLIEIYDKVRTLFAGDDNLACLWLIQKNPFFFDSSPVESVLVNGPASLLDFLNERLGK